MTKATYKRPLHRIRSHNRQWLVQPPEPEPPDPPDAGSEGRLAGSVNYHRAPVTKGGLIVPGPTLRRRPQVASAAEPPISRRRTQVTMVSDAEAGPSGPALPSRYRMKFSPMNPELGRQDSVLESPAAQSMAQKAFQNRELREYVKRAEGRAQAAYEQSCAALKLILMSMEKVRTASAEAKHARDRYHALLSVSRSRENIHHRCANARSPPGYMAGQQHHLRGRSIASEGCWEAQPFANGLMDSGAEVYTAQWTPSGVHRALDTQKTRVREWVETQYSLSPPQPSGKELGNTKSGMASPVVRADQILAPHNPVKPTTGPAAGPQQTAGERVSWLDRYSHPSTCNPLNCKMPPHDQRVEALVVITWDPGGHPGSPRLCSSSTIQAPVPATDAAADALLAPLGDLVSLTTSAPVLPICSILRWPPLTHSRLPHNPAPGTNETHVDPPTNFEMTPCHPRDP